MDVCLNLQKVYNLDSQDLPLLAGYIQVKMEKYGYCTENAFTAFPDERASRPLHVIAVAKFSFGSNSRVYGIVLGREDELAETVVADFQLDRDRYLYEIRNQIS